MENTAGTVTDDLCQYTDWSNGRSPTIPGGSYQGLTRDFAIAGGSTTSLPVKLLSLTAIPIENKFIRINWSTALEINNDKFIVERSTDAVIFKPIGEVSGNGTKTTPTTYSFNDYEVVAGITYYYRLRQIDYDGTDDLSQIVSALAASQETPEVRLYPNPNQGTFTLVTSENSGTTTVHMVNTIGQRVYEEHFPDQPETTRRIISVDVPSGTYTVIITSERDAVTTQKITIVH